LGYILERKPIVMLSPYWGAFALGFTYYGFLRHIKRVL